MKNFLKKRRLYFSLPILLFVLAMRSPTIAPGIIDLNNLENYANQEVPSYITKDNTPSDNPITDGGATLGRVLFYDTKLSINQSISCATCHQQSSAFSDTEDVSIGVNGVTARHSPRMTNLRFGEEAKFFWDETASSLEDLILTPIESHIEMGFSGQNGQPGLDSLFNRLVLEEYYQDLFTFTFGDPEINNERIEKAIAQFLRSIQSFDSKYDEGRSEVTHDSIPFSNYDTNENFGKQVFLNSPEFDDLGNRIAGGAGCASCHRPPEFDIDPDSGNNGEIGVFGSSTEIDISVTRAPSLRNVADEENKPYGGFMHNATMGEISKIYGVIGHYNEIPDVSNNPNIDDRLVPNGHPQRLHLSTAEIIGLASFLKTLRGYDVFTNEKWSNPFDQNGNLTIIPVSITSTLEPEQKEKVLLFPNPVNDFLSIQSDIVFSHLHILNSNGKLLETKDIVNNQSIDMSQLPSGFYFIRLMNKEHNNIFTKKIVVY